MRSILDNIINTIDCDFEICDVVDNFNYKDVEWIYSYPLYFQYDLIKIFWVYCLNNYKSVLNYRDMTDELEVINEILHENNIEPITKEEAIEICKKNNIVSLNEFNKFLVYIINTLYIRLYRNDDDNSNETSSANSGNVKPEYIRLSRLKELIKMLNNHYIECKENNEQTNYDKICEYIHKYMKVIHIERFWSNIPTKINDINVFIDLYYETVDTNDKYLVKVFFADYNDIDETSRNEILAKAINASLHMLTRTDFMLSRTTNDIHLLALYPWKNRMIKFRYDNTIESVLTC